MSASQWMIYGAYGYTGTLIAEEAVRRGHRPILAGRAPEKLMPLAQRLGLQYVAVDLHDTARLTQLLRRVDLVLNAAGPFIHTSEALIQPCLATATNYLDVGNEIPAFQAVQAQDAAARQCGVALMSGVGFGVTATNCLVKYVAQQVPDAVEIACAMVPYNQQSSSGAAKTILELLPGGGTVRRNGKRVASRLGTGAIAVQFPDGARTVVPVPTADLEAAYQATGVPDVTAYAEFPMSPLFLGVLPLLGRLLKIRAIRLCVEQMLDRRTPAPQGASQGTTRPSYAWARAVDRHGRAVQAWLELGEGYAFTAAASVRAAERVLTQRPAGALTPAEAFGADFVLEIPGTKRYSSLPPDADRARDQRQGVSAHAGRTAKSAPRN